MSITTQIFISCDLPVSPRSSQFELRPRLPSTTTWQGNGGSPSSTDLGMDTLVCALNGHELLSCSSSATLDWEPPQARIAFRARTANGEMQRNSRNLDRRDAKLLNDETNGCPLVTATIWDGVDTLIPICRAHTAPVGPATYFVRKGRIHGLLRMLYTGQLDLYLRLTLGHAEPQRVIP